MRVLDLFSGLHGWSSYFTEMGHEVVSIEINTEQIATLHADIGQLTADDIRALFGGHNPDVIIASPPCTTFSVASIWKHWTGGHQAYEPATQEARDSLVLMAHTLQLIQDLQPKWWWLENPRGILRKLDVMNGLNRVTIWMCQYHSETDPMKRAKPTDLWGEWPEEWIPRPECKNSNPDCYHVRAPRCTNTGTQAISNRALRALIPRELSKDVCLACEEAMKNEYNKNEM